MTTLEQNIIIILLKNAMDFLDSTSGRVEENSSVVRNNELYNSTMEFVAGCIGGIAAKHSKLFL